MTDVQRNPKVIGVTQRGDVVRIDYSNGKHAEMTKAQYDAIEANRGRFRKLFLPKWPRPLDD